METSNYNEIPGIEYFFVESEDDFGLNEYNGENPFFDQLVPQNHCSPNNFQEIEENIFDVKSVANRESKSKNGKHSTKEQKNESSIKGENTQKIIMDRQKKIYCKEKR